VVLSPSLGPRGGMRTTCTGFREAGCLLQRGCDVNFQLRTLCEPIGMACLRNYNLNIGPAPQGVHSRMVVKFCYVLIRGGRAPWLPHHRGTAAATCHQTTIHPGPAALVKRTEAAAAQHDRFTGPF